VLTSFSGKIEGAGQCDFLKPDLLVLHLLQHHY